MDKPKTPQLTIDREFRDLIRPLMKDEYRYLESTLISEGCQEPITVWKGIIVDGHNRYEICTRLGIPFDTRERHFDNGKKPSFGYAPDSWGRRNISDETRRYLIGKRYEAEKVIAAKRNYNGWNQYRKREHSGDLPYEVIDPDAQQEKIRTSQRIGRRVPFGARNCRKVRYIQQGHRCDCEERSNHAFHAYCPADTKYRTTML